ncbi:uncharacterized protein LOC132719790 [Ruditapes philippinarum]|uniref:uncharacterized protein LOC132719790 n=1 Tax=Ruditapes philippinarum TaxID=129788 RepID=UPI00295BCBE0|nr:uncharacterized protein LOC132719790 [Ruditapes philippinarum]
MQLNPWVVSILHVRTIEAAQAVRHHRARHQPAAQLQLQLALKPPPVQQQAVQPVFLPALQCRPQHSLHLCYQAAHQAPIVAVREDHWEKSKSTLNTSRVQMEILTINSSLIRNLVSETSLST